MSPSSPLIIAVVDDLNSALCRFVQCVHDHGEYNGNADVLMCLKQCTGARAPIVINVTNCNWGNPVTYGNAKLRSIKCCISERTSSTAAELGAGQPPPPSQVGDGCVRLTDEGLIITGYIPKIYLNLMINILLNDINVLWGSVVNNGAVNRLVNIILAERGSFGLSRTLMGLVKALKTGDTSNLNRETVSILEELGIADSGVLVDKDKLRVLIDEVIRVVYP